MKSRSVLQLQYEEGRTVVREYPVRDLDAVLVLGKGLYIESSAVSVLSSMNVPMAVVAGDSVGVLLNPVIVASPNYRRLQYTVDRVRAIEIALEYIKSKVGGMINVLRYHGGESPEVPGPPRRPGTPRWSSLPLMLSLGLSEGRRPAFHELLVYVPRQPKVERHVLASFQLGQPRLIVRDHPPR